jgi:hypothetical protein
MPKIMNRGKEGKIVSRHGHRWAGNYFPWGNTAALRRRCQYALAPATDYFFAARAAMSASNLAKRWSSWRVSRSFSAFGRKA